MGDTVYNSLSALSLVISGDILLQCSLLVLTACNHRSVMGNAHSVLIRRVITGHQWGYIIILGLRCSLLCLRVIISRGWGMHSSMHSLGLLSPVISGNTVQYVHYSKKHFTRLHSFTIHDLPYLIHMCNSVYIPNCRRIYVLCCPQYPMTSTYREKTGEELPKEKQF
jgi:hypothetical protein